MDDLVNRPDFRGIVADQCAEMAALDPDPFRDRGEVGGDATVLQPVGADLDEHQRITNGSGMGSSEVRNQTVLVRV